MGRATGWVEVGKVGEKWATSVIVSTIKKNLRQVLQEEFQKALLPQEVAAPRMR